MIKLLLTTLVLSIISAILYRFGGLGQDGWEDFFKDKLPRWLFSKKIRRGFCTLFSISWMAMFYPHVPWWVHMLSFGLVLLGVTTYFDSAKFNWMRPDDNFYLHGFFIALGCILYPIFTGMWLGFGLRVIVLALLMGLLSEKWADPIVIYLKAKLSKYPKLYTKIERFIKDDWVEELGRGLLIILTKILMLIK